MNISNANSAEKAVEIIISAPAATIAVKKAAEAATKNTIVANVTMPPNSAMAAANAMIAAATAV